MLHLESGGKTARF